MFVSTTGDGEQCDSIRDTWKALLQKSLPRNLFSGQRFAMFCLGDRAYGPQFCAAGRKLAVRLMQLGMTSACELGYGDDNTPNGGVFRDLDAWLEDKLLPILGGRSTPLTDHDKYDIPTCPFRIRVTDGGTMTHSDSSQADDGNSDDEWQQTRFADSYQEYFGRASPKTAYKYNSTGERIVEQDGIKRLSDQSQKNALIGTVLRNERITSADWEQNTRGIQIQIASSERDKILASRSENLANLPYLAGDVASILPFNSKEEVNRFLKVLPGPLASVADSVLEIDVDEKLMDSSFARWPRLCTFRGWLTYCADIHSLPEREDLRALSVYCSPDHPLGMDQRHKLFSLSETSEAALYADYILREKRSWADVLYDFESLRAAGSRLTFQSLLVLIPPMRPRDFSIASSPSAEKLDRSKRDTTNQFSEFFSIELCVAVVEGTTRRGRKYHGLCSEFLSRMLPSSSDSTGVLKYPKLIMWIRPGTFGKMPLEIVDQDSTHQRSFKTPILCVGAGTGVAPLRSLLLERNAVRELATDRFVPSESSTSTGTDRDENILVFGCRKEVADYYYKDEWEGLGSENRIRVLTAFSRDQVQRIYVQKVLREADGGNLLANHILNRRGAVYIAGGPKMARAVKEEIVEALAASLGSEKQANQLLSKLQRAGQFGIEAWS
jgi:sulfite reductase alpha subunit-like flavoprotein